MPLAGKKLLIPAATLIGLLACTGSGGGVGVSSGYNVVTTPAGKREAAPPFSGEKLTGGPISSELLAGKVGVVNFWGTWCGPCRREQPMLEALSKQYASNEVQFVGINARRDQKASALAYLDEFRVTYPSVFNPDSSIAYQFKVRFMPATFVIDKQGKIAAQVIGALRSEADLRALIDSVLP